MKNQDQINTLKKRMKGYLSFIELNDSKLPVLSDISDEARILRNETKRFKKYVCELEKEIERLESEDIKND